MIGFRYEILEYKIDISSVNKIWRNKTTSLCAETDRRRNPIHCTPQFPQINSHFITGKTISSCKTNDKEPSEAGCHKFCLLTTMARNTNVWNPSEATSICSRRSQKALGKPEAINYEFQYYLFTAPILFMSPCVVSSCQDIL